MDKLVLCDLALKFARPILLIVKSAPKKEASFKNLLYSQGMRGEYPLGLTQVYTLR